MALNIHLETLYCGYKLFQILKQHCNQFPTYRSLFTIYIYYSSSYLIGPQDGVFKIFISKILFLEPITKFPVIFLNCTWSFSCYMSGILQKMMSGTNYEPLYYILNIREMLKMTPVQHLLFTNNLFSKLIQIQHT